MGMAWDYTNEAFQKQAIAKSSKEKYSWEQVIDFTRIKKGGVAVGDLLLRL